MGCPDVFGDCGSGISGFLRGLLLTAFRTGLLFAEAKRAAIIEADFFKSVGEALNGRFLDVAVLAPAS